MIIVIIIAVIAVIAAIVVLVVLPDDEDKRKKYLTKLTQLVEGQMAEIEGAENSFRIRFRYHERDFVYEDILDKGFQEQPVQRGYLKLATGTDLVLSFTERERASLISGDSQFSASSAWRKNLNRSRQAKKLKSFGIYTNNQAFADALMDDDEVINIFADFKNVDHRGHPFMAMEILNGELVLRFYSQAGYQPNLFDLESNVSKIENFLGILLKMAELIHKIGYRQGFII